MSAAPRSFPDAEPDADGQAGTELDGLATAHVEGRELAEAGDLTGARTILEAALADAGQRLGRDHPRLAPLMVDLATIARHLGNLTEAQNQLRRAYTIIVASSGPDDPTALSVEGRLATVNSRLGEPTEALDWHLADVGLRVLGPEHPSVRGARQRLAARPPAPAPAEEVPFPRRPPIPDSDEPDEDDESDTDGAYEPGYAPTYAADAGAGAGLYQAHPVPSAAYQPHPTAAGVYQRHAGDPPPRYADPYREENPAQQAYATRDDGYTSDDGYPSDDDEAPYDQPRARRASIGGTALVASLGVAVLVAATIVGAQLLRPDPGGDAQSAPATITIPATSTAPTATPPPLRPPPSGLTLTDNGGSVTLRWADPSSGSVSFIVAGGRRGQASTSFESVPAGRTTSTIYGLNHRYDYCFTVAAVWSSDTIMPSAQTCTRRSSTGAPS